MKLNVLIGLVCLAGGTHAQSVATLENQIKSLQTQVATLRSQILAVQQNPVLQIGPFVSFDPNPENGVIGPHITFKGVNVHIVSGTGNTGDYYSGLGNLLIGYDEAQAGELAAGDRGGANNLVIGRYNKFRTGSFGGIVQGDSNEITCEENVAIGGGGNTVTGSYAVVIGGSSNTAASYLSAEVGGFDNATGGTYQLMLGGCANVPTQAEFQTTLGVNNGTTIGLQSVQ